MNQFDKLPIEIFNRILTEVVNNLEIRPMPAHSIEPPTELLELRLVSKAWSKAVIQLYFQAIVILNRDRARLIINNWKDDLYAPDLQCPVRILHIIELGHTHADRCEMPPEERDFRHPTIEQVVRLIELLGENLKMLYISLECCLKVSPDLIKAIKTIKNLKWLSIEFQNETAAYDLDSLSDLISAIPKLERLSLQWDSSEILDVKPPALSNLNYFSLTCEKNVAGISNITEASKNRLKTIALFGDHQLEGLRQVLEPVKDTVEGLFTTRISRQLGQDVLDLNFQKLRVIGTQPVLRPTMSELDWMNAPMFKNVRTIVINKNYLKDALKLSGVDVLKKLTNLKHCRHYSGSPSGQGKMIGSMICHKMVYHSTPEP